MTDRWVLQNGITEATKKLMLRDAVPYPENRPIVNRKLTEFEEISDGSDKLYMLCSWPNPHP
jgi:hypothetical protein